MCDPEESGSSAGSSNGPQIQTKDRIRVLCIHGYRQNEHSFRNKLGSFRKYIEKYVECTFITAPHQAPPFPGEEEATINGMFIVNLNVK